MNYTTLFLGKNIIHFDSLSSTNQYAIDLLSKNKPTEGTVIITDNQYAGRGQIGSKWESEPQKNLNLSIILYPTFLLARQQFELNKAICLGVRDFVATHLTNRVTVKWSNDIYVGQKKICGILIQNSLMGKGISSSVVGIGININQTEFVTNPPNPTSFASETNRTYNLEELKAQLYVCIERRYLQLRNGQFQRLTVDYLRHLYRYNKVATYERIANGERFTGMIVGITNFGQLKIQKTDDTIEQFNFKEVKFL